MPRSRYPLIEPESWSGFAIGVSPHSRRTPLAFNIYPLHLLTRATGWSAPFCDFHCRGTLSFSSIYCHRPPTRFLSRRSSAHYPPWVSAADEQQCSDPGNRGRRPHCRSLQRFRQEGKLHWPEEILEASVISFSTLCFSWKVWDFSHLRLLFWTTFQVIIVSFRIVPPHCTG